MYSGCDAIVDESLDFGIRVFQCKCREVGICRPRGMRKVDHQRRWPRIIRKITCVTSEKRGTIIQSKIHHSKLSGIRMRWIRLLIRDRGEDNIARSIEHKLAIRGNHGRPIWPILDIGARVDRKDEIDIPLFLQDWPQRDILEILPAIDEGDVFKAGNGVGGAVDATEGIGIDGDVFLCFVEDLEDRCDDECGGGFIGGGDLKKDLVEKG
jgi:hypothetical protein